MSGERLLKVKKKVRKEEGRKGSIGRIPELRVYHSKWTVTYHL